MQPEMLYDFLQLCFWIVALYNKGTNGCFKKA